MSFLKELFLFSLKVLCCILFYKLVKFLVCFWKFRNFFKLVPGPPVKTSSEVSGPPVKTSSVDSTFKGHCLEKVLKFEKVWIVPFFPFIRVYHPDTIRPVLEKDGLRKSSFFGVFHRMTLVYNSLGPSDDLSFVKERRRIMSPFFKRTLLTRYHIEISNATETMITKIESKQQMKERWSVNLYPLLTRLMAGIHLKIFLSFDPKKNPHNVEEFLSAEQEWTKLKHLRNKKWYLYPDFVYYLTPNGIRDYLLVRRIRRIAKAWLDSKQQPRNTQDSYDVMDEIINKSGQYLYDAAISFAVSIRNVVSAATMVLLHLGKYPSYQKMIRTEVKDLFKGNDIRTDLQERDFTRLLNTMMFLKEVLRKHPPANNTERQITDDLEVDGITFPKGTYFLIDINALHHNEDLWDNPDEFKPERFADDPKPNSTDGLKFLPFLSYSRGCIAKRFVIEEIVIIVARILQRFEIECDERFVMSDDRINQMPENGVRMYFKSIK